MPAAAPIVLTASIDQRVFIDPANTGGIGTKDRACSCRQTRFDLAESFDHTGARPIRIRSIVEQHVHEGIAKDREAPHRRRTWHGAQRSCQRESNLILDDLRRIAREAGADDTWTSLRSGKASTGTSRATHTRASPATRPQTEPLPASSARLR
jgi:hypothetical protein